MLQNAICNKWPFKIHKINCYIVSENLDKKTNILSSIFKIPKVKFIKIILYNAIKNGNKKNVKVNSEYDFKNIVLSILFFLYFMLHF